MKLQRLYKVFFSLVLMISVLPAQQIQLFSKIKTLNKSRLGNQIIDSNNQIRAAFRLNETKYNGNRESKARRFLREKVQSFRSKQVDSESQIVLQKEQTSQTSSHLRFNQSYKGISVYQSDIVVSFTKNDAISMLMSNYKSSINIKDIQVQINQDVAIQIAKSQLIDQTGLDMSKAKLMILDNGNDDRLVYKINLPISNQTITGDFEFLIDANSGEILQIKDLQKNHLQNERKRKKKKKASGQAYVFDPNPLSLSGSNYGDGDPINGFFDNNDANSDSLNKYRSLVTLNDLKFENGVYSLQNEFVNSVDVHGPTNTSPTSTDSNGFQYTRDQEEFEAVNVYYHIDKSRRYLEALGFTDINPNDQAGANGPKSIKVDAHGLTIDNSHFFSSTDHICWGDGGVDDAEDADVIWHELGHAIQDFIVDGFAGNEGLGEGFSDYWAQSYTRSFGFYESTDPLYSKVFIWDGNNPAINWFGRTTNFNGHYPDNLTSSIHQNGQLWSTPLMRIFDQVGRNVMDQLVIKSHYYLSASADQVANAEAILQADFDLFGGIHSAIIRAEFTSYGQLNDLYPAPENLISENYLDQKINLRWEFNQLALPDSWIIERSLNLNGPYTEIFGGSLDSLFYSDTTVTNETNYYYQVKATYSGQSSSYTNRVLAIASEFGPPAEIPDILTFEDADIEQIDLNVIFGINNSYQLISNSKENLLTTIISDDKLIISYLADQSGVASIALEITNIDTVKRDTFNIEVQAVDDAPRILDSLPDLTIINPPAENDTIELLNRYYDVDSENLSFIVLESSTSFSAKINDNKLILRYPIASVSIIPVTLSIIADGKIATDEFIVALTDELPPDVFFYTELTEDFDQTGSFLIKTSFSEALLENPILKLQTSKTDSNYQMELNTSSGFYESQINIGESDQYQFTAFYSDLYGNSDSASIRKTVQFVDPSKKKEYQLTDSIKMVLSANYNQKIWIDFNQLKASFSNNLVQITPTYRFGSTSNFPANSYLSLEFIVPSNNVADQRKIGLYQQNEDRQWAYQGGEVSSGIVKAEIESFGTVALFYNPDHQFLANKLELVQNYPNPFNPSTTIRVKLDQRTRVVIDIFNSLGQRVKRLVDRELSHKNHEFIWDASNQSGNQLPSGIYFYQVRTNYSIQTKKMVLIR